jgi:ferredoxin-NADP reductase
MEYTTTLLRTEEIARGTQKFVFAKPDGFSFVAGQYVALVLPGVQSAVDKDKSHKFSIASSPLELDIEISTRMRDTVYKKTLGALKVGDSVTLKGPMGNFVLPTEPTRMVILTGGIGITPFMSMLRYCVAAMMSHRITVMYSNRAPQDTAYLQELDGMVGSNIDVVHTMTDMPAEDRSWSGEHGFIDEAMIKRHVNDFDAAHYFIAGPPKMVEAMRGVLNSMKVPVEQVHTEDFEGY